MAKVLIITGLPATGKTTLGKELARRLGIPFFSKDGIKELLFDGLGWQDRAWSKKMGVVSYDLLYHVVESLLGAGISFIVESDFKSQFDNAKFQEFKNNYHFECVQILCKTEGEVLFERFKKRAESGERHPGHADTGNYEEFKNLLLSSVSDPLDIPGKIIEVDTTDLNKIDVDRILSSIHQGPS